MRVGIFGGSFNPVHQQHLQIAHAAKKTLDLDEIWFIPVFRPVHKRSDDFLAYEKRRGLLSHAIKTEAQLRICDAEKELGGLSYTVRTVKYLQEQFPATNFFLLIGGDSLAELASWRNIDELVKLVEFVVVERPGFAPQSPVPEAIVHWVETDVSNVSSSRIREELRSGKFSHDSLDRNVLYQILRNNYYSSLGIDYSKLMEQIDEYLEKLPAGLSLHIENVARDAFDLAIVGNLSPVAAVISGLSHDLFRVATSEEILSYVEKSAFKLSVLEKSLPMLAHGAASAGFLVNLFPGIDKEILEAVRSHTSPGENLGLLGRLLVVADALEPSRCIDERSALRKQNLPLNEKYLKVLEIKRRAAAYKSSSGKI